MEPTRLAQEVRRRTLCRLDMGKLLTPHQIIIERECEAFAAGVGLRDMNRVTGEVNRLRNYDPMPEFF